MAKTDEQLAQEQLADRGVDYKYGGDSLFGAFMPERRRILRPEQEQFIGYDSSGNAIIQNIPAEYGPSEVDPSFAPIVRGVKRGLSFLNDVFLGDANEQNAAIGQAVSAMRDIGEGIADYAGGQARSALAGGVSFNQDTGQIDRFDPLVVMGGGGAPSGSLASGFGRSRSALDTSTAARMQRAFEDFDLRPAYHYTNALEDGGEFTQLKPSIDGKYGPGIYSSRNPEYGERYLKGQENARAIPIYIRGETARKEDWFDALNEAANDARDMRQMGIEMTSPEIRRMAQNLLRDKGYDSLEFDNEIVVFDPKNVRSVNAQFDPELRESANILYSGGGNTGTGVAAGSALRESFRVGDEGFDPRFDSRAKEQERIQSTDLQYDVRPFERPEVSIFDYEGKPFRLTMSDRTAAGRDLAGVEGVEYDIPINLQGGQDFMFANPLGREGQVWAQDKGATSAFLNSFQGLDGRPISDEFLILPYRMAPTSGDFATMTGEVMVTHARNNVPTRAKRQADATIRQFYPAWKGIDNPESLQQISQMSGDPRKSLLQVMDRDLRNEGGLGIGQARLAVSDRAQYNAPDFALQNVGIVNPDIGSRFDISGHRTYGQGLAGRPEGILKEQDINAFELMPDLVSARGFDSVEALLGADPATLAKEQYTLRRGIRGGTITEDMLRDIERRRSQ